MVDEQPREPREPRTSPVTPNEGLAGGPREVVLVGCGCGVWSQLTARDEALVMGRHAPL